jgi:NAD(P)-dependent dehydrogenase (short-subunit alcohol dehydrogenase family)
MRRGLPSNQALRLESKVAIITGGASGIGRAAATRFAVEGAQVVIADLNEGAAMEVASAIVKGGGSAIAVTVDITVPSDLEHLVDRTIDQFGQIDILINNAGIFDRYASSLETSEADWDRIFMVNIKSIFNLTNLVLPGMIERHSGSIVNIASVAGLVAQKGGAAYTASKHAVVGYTKHLAAAYGKEGVKVNAICPGTIRTPLTSDLIDTIPIDAIPVGRVGEVSDVSDLAAFLASDEARFLHGAVIPIDGGFTIL